jgi:hypothetical protein
MEELNGYPSEESLDFLHREASIKLELVEEFLDFCQVDDLFLLVEFVEGVDFLGREAGVRKTVEQEPQCFVVLPE